MKYMLLLLFVLLKGTHLPAQTVYQGRRVAVFDVEILQQKNRQVNLKCRLANTGSLPLTDKKRSEEWVVEFDTNGLPARLRGHETAIAAVVREECPPLKPGEMATPLWLNVRLLPRDTAIANSTGCADLSFDTAFVEAWTDRSIQVRFLLVNKGSMPAHLFAKNIEPLVKAYFVSGDKLTRGAIPAGSLAVQKGRETLDGILLPGEVLEGTITLDTKDRSRFSPNIALEFDPAQVVEECDRVGNVRVLRLRY